MKIFLLSLLSASTAFAGALTIGPDYQRPSVPAPADYRGGEGLAGRPSLPPSSWWTLFNSPVLDDLESQALSANQDLKSAAARAEQSAAAAGIVRGAFWPQVAAVPAASRSQTSRTSAIAYPQALFNDFTVPVQASWEIDLFGRVRRLSESARADAQAAAYLFDSVRLSLTAAVAVDYFTLRGLDQELAILRQTADLRHRELDLVSAQRRSGAATELDTARAETELATAQADSAAVAARRESVQDALAVLVGRDAPSFTLPASVENITAPSIPTGLPSELLQRRPDIASAERTLAAANARIGVAKAAFFPAISLTGSAGYDSGQSGQLFKADSRIWSFGPSLYLPIFQGGRNKADYERVKAAFDENLAAYRQQVLVAFREVQESLAVLKLLSEQSEAQDRAVASAKRAAELAQLRYRSGYVSYLDVVDAQRTELGNERASAQLSSGRLNTEVALIKALGGGWSIRSAN